MSNIVLVVIVELKKNFSIKNYVSKIEMNL